MSDPLPLLNLHKYHNMLSHRPHFNTATGGTGQNRKINTAQSSCLIYLIIHDKLGILVKDRILSFTEINKVLHVSLRMDIIRCCVHQMIRFSDHLRHVNSVTMVEEILSGKKHSISDWKLKYAKVTVKYDKVIYVKVNYTKVKVNYDKIVYVKVKYARVKVNNTKIFV